MALTATEQLKLMSGDVKPPSNVLDVLVHQSAFMFSKIFADTYKSIPSGDTEAALYLEKMRGFSNRVITNSGGNVSILTRIISTIIGAEPSVTMSVLEGASDDQWSDFILDKMQDAYEYASNVSQSEKAAYQAI